jgi:hypothetical protein
LNRVANGSIAIGSCPLPAKFGEVAQ